MSKECTTAAPDTPIRPTIRPLVLTVDDAVEVLIGDSRRLVLENVEAASDLASKLASAVSTLTPASQDVVEMLADLYETAGHPFDPSTIATKADVQKASLWLGSNLGRPAAAEAVQS